MKRSLLLVGLLSTGISQAQLTITDSLTIGSIATLLEGLNVTVSNVTVNCAGEAMAHFSGTSELAITEGLLLTTGAADMVAGPSSNMATWTTGTPGDVDLDAQTGAPTYDACALEFDCVPLGDTLLFNFSFGSEEYPEYVGSAFNDAFAIYISGPGFLTPTNVAAIPGGTLVAINNVNSGTNPMYFYDNYNGMNVTMDGFTTNLTAFAVVVPGETYHFKVVIADVSDMAFDSAVFLEAFSFRSPMLTTGVPDAPAPGFGLVQVDGVLVLRSPTDLVHGQRVLVFDASGRVVAQQAVNSTNTQIATADLGSGMYVVKVLDAGTAPLRFVKE